MVRISAPSAWAANIVHDFTDSPPTSTVHAPHEDVSQPILVPVRPQASRRNWTSRVRGSTSCCWLAPFTVMLICIGPPCVRPLSAASRNASGSASSEVQPLTSGPARVTEIRMMQRCSRRIASR